MEESGSDTSDTEYFSAESESDTYECDPGLCVIMNNVKFNRSAKLSELKGGEVDENNLKKLFNGLGFTVMVHRNLTAEKMKSTAEGYSHMTHSGVFYLIILSHGGEGDVVYGTDGKKVDVHQLKEFFYAKNCPSLADIPKIFLIDACRGSRNEGVHHFQTKHTNPSPKRRGSARDSEDFYTIFASTRGTTAGIHPERGSLLTRNFVDAVTKANHEKNFEDIMKEVKRRMRTQTVETTSTLDKDYYIKKYEVDNEASEDSQQQKELQRYQALQERFTETVRHWLLVREKTIREVTETATELENHCNVNMPRITISFVFTCIYIISLVIISSLFIGPLMLSIILSFITIGFIVVLILLQRAVSGTAIVDKIIEKEQEIQKQLDEDSLQVELIQQVAKDIQVANTNMQVDTAAPVIAAIQVGNVDMTVGEINIVASRIQEFLGISFKRAVPFARSIYYIAKGFPKNASKRLNELAKELEEQMRSIKKEANIE